MGDGRYYTFYQFYLSLILIILLIIVTSSMMISYYKNKNKENGINVSFIYLFLLIGIISLFVENVINIMDIALILRWISTISLLVSLCM
ncbi:MAG: hypothetical protein PF505_05610, partial [Vallitaleaceae bacterium]|nr:hypothetical protein [Vallitaleaceae bacterium]